MAKLKETSYSYGNEYQNRQIEKYKNRYSNHWKYRIKNFENLLQKINTDLPENKVSIIDIGTSIGTFALEAAKKGYNASGIDFDPEAIKLAEKLSDEENLDVKFICGDISPINYED